MRVKAYLHLEPYNEGDKAWYQHQDRNAWCGPVLVVAQIGNNVWVYALGDKQKFAACEVMLYELVEIDVSITEKDHQVIGEDCLLDDEKMNVTEEKYLKIENIKYF